VRTENAIKKSTLQKTKTIKEKRDKQRHCYKAPRPYPLFLFVKEQNENENLIHAFSSLRYYNWKDDINLIYI